MSNHTVAAAAPGPDGKDASAPAFAQWVCNVCGWIYDEAQGDPEHGLPPGTRMADIPDTWYCPECGVTTADFSPLDF